MEQSTKYLEMKKRLAPIAAKMEKEEKANPSLLLPEVDCPKPVFPESGKGGLEGLCGL